MTNMTMLLILRGGGAIYSVGVDPVGHLSMRSNESGTEGLLRYEAVLRAGLLWATRSYATAPQRILANLP